MKPDPVRQAIDKLIVEKGEEKNKIWRARLTVKEVLEQVPLPNTPDHQRYVIYIVGRWYEGSKVAPGQSDNGGFLEMTVRGV